VSASKVTHDQNWQISQKTKNKTKQKTLTTKPLIFGRSPPLSPPCNIHTYYPHIRTYSHPCLVKEKHSQVITIYPHNENYQKNNCKQYTLFLDIPKLSVMYLKHLCDLLNVVLFIQICQQNVNIAICVVLNILLSANIQVSKVMFPLLSRC